MHIELLDANIICGPPPRARGLRMVLATWSGAVIRPARWYGAYGRWPGWSSRIGSLSRLRAMRVDLFGSSQSTARPFRHHVLFALAILRTLRRVQATCPNDLFGLIAVSNAPSSPRRFGRPVGEWDRNEFSRLSRRHRAHPFAILGRTLARAEWRQPPRQAASEYICRRVCWFVPAALCRPRNSAAGRYAEPGREFSPRPEQAWIRAMARQEPCQRASSPIPAEHRARERALSPLRLSRKRPELLVL
jgi:hypothetical protein